MKSYCNPNEFQEAFIYMPLYFLPSSVFGSIEVKNLDPVKVNALTVLLVIKETDT